VSVSCYNAQAKSDFPHRRLRERCLRNIETLMDDGIQGMIVMGLVAPAALAYVYYGYRRQRAGKNDLHPTDSDPRAQPVALALRAGNAGPFLNLLASVGTDYDARAYYLKELAPHCRRDSVDALCARAPTPLSYLVRGCQSIAWAWQARGSGGSNTVSQEGWKLFGERLAMAERDLLLAAQGDVTDPTPFSNLLVAARGMDAPDETAWRYFEHAVARQPDHHFAHEAMRSKLSRRWGGSDEEMFAFVRRSAWSAPGSDLPMLVFEAHLDVWSYIHTFEGDPERARRYLAQPAVRQELYDAYAKSLEARCRVRASTIYHRNSAAFVFFLLQDVARLRIELAHIGQAFTEYPWVYFRQAEQATRDVVATAKMIAGAGR
jgi:hypothetical protein